MSYFIAWRVRTSDTHRMGECFSEGVSDAFQRGTTTAHSYFSNNYYLVEVGAGKS